MEEEKLVEQCKKEKCFVIMPISDQGDYPPGHFTKIYEQIIKPAIEDAGYEAFRVDEDKMSTSILEKIFDAIQTCPMAVCDLSNRNPNVLYELGLRQAYDKPVVLIKDDKTESIFDVAGINTILYKSSRLYEDVLTARQKLKEAIIENRNSEGSNSMVKIIKAQQADYNAVDVSNADKTQIMFSEILNRIGQMENNKQKEYYFFNKKQMHNLITHERHDIMQYHERINSLVNDSSVEIHELYNLRSKIMWKIDQINSNKVLLDDEKENLLKEWYFELERLDKIIKNIN